MCYTDTESFILHIKSEDLFIELKSHPELRDLIDFSVFQRVIEVVPAILKTRPLEWLGSSKTNATVK